MWRRYLAMLAAAIRILLAALALLTGSTPRLESVERFADKVGDLLAASSSSCRASGPPQSSERNR